MTESATRLIAATQAKTRFGEMIHEVASEGTRFIVQNRGVPQAVVISLEEYEDILETEAELRDPEYLASIAESRLQYELGEVGDMSDIYASLERARRRAHDDQDAG